MSPRSESSVYQLMAARGNYTCFAYTNETIREYLQTVVEEGLIDEPTWESFITDMHSSAVGREGLAEKKIRLDMPPMI